MISSLETPGAGSWNNFFKEIDPYSTDRQANISNRNEAARIFNPKCDIEKPFKKLLDELDQTSKIITGVHHEKLQNLQKNLASLLIKYKNNYSLLSTLSISLSWTSQLVKDEINSTDVNSIIKDSQKDSDIKLKEQIKDFENLQNIQDELTKELMILEREYFEIFQDYQYSKLTSKLKRTAGEAQLPGGNTCSSFSL